MNIGLYLFSHDLRLSDQPLLTTLSGKVDKLICASWQRPVSQWDQGKLPNTAGGEHQKRFYQQGLCELAQQLAQKNHLLYPIGDLFSALESLSTAYPNATITLAHCAFAGVDERRYFKALAERFTHIRFCTSHHNHLLTAEQGTFEPGDFPRAFFPFRKQVMALNPSDPIDAPSTLAAPLAVDALAGFQQPVSSSPPHAGASVIAYGGESHGLAHLAGYFATRCASEYKQTRNGLTFSTSSTCLSIWLAQGAISAKQVVKQLRAYESEHGRNASTEWIYFELLWREYFYWFARHHQQRLFWRQGLRQSAPLTTFYPQRFRAWCEGKTSYPIVNACINQLRATGWMSNRGRQLVASCLVNELGLDWRFGAAFFQHHLIDYDVASNWGNWMSIAGVASPGGTAKHFDLAEQTQWFDPKGEFIARWQGQQKPIGEVVDGADWPL
ncbi:MULTISPECIES: DASH family cryptochrome [unclassified Vibrio]|uniref:Cryptochrome DASH n=1 Tax=Vibrio sp. HB236076 TaxID=3232307 RepID=A0AB39HLS8_9VIBR|nr:DASH family cryptochrome [Vibrio sp. HB161653]MDP5253111.1 DASH family cryptochrome [Vibrio sp. HB161653]